MLKKVSFFTRPTPVRRAAPFRGLCSRKTLPPHYLGGVHKRDALYSARREPRRLNVRPREKSLSRQARGRPGKNAYASPPRHCRLTISPASANVTLIILRVADLAGVSLEDLFEHPVSIRLTPSDNGSRTSGRVDPAQKKRGGEEFPSAPSMFLGWRAVYSSPLQKLRS
jgi:hypothetical protein